MKAIEYNDAPLKDEVLDRIAGVIGEGKIQKGERTIITPETEADVCAAVKAVIDAKGAISSKAAKHCGENDVVLDFSKMKAIEFIDTVNMTVKVQVGCRFEDLENAVEAKGFFLGAIPAGKDATVEDWVYTEAPGIGSYKYGTIKDNVFNVYAVDCGGNAIETGYDIIGYYMSGYNLTQTMVASAGRIGIITAVTLQMYPAGTMEVASYEVAGPAELQTFLEKVGQEPSVKPYHISFNGNKVVVAYQGSEEFVRLDMEATDALMEGATKIEDDLWTGIEGAACMCPSSPTFYIPVKNLAAFIEYVNGTDYKVAGNVPDCTTVAVKIRGGESDIDEIADMAETLGGRCSKRCASKYRTPETNAFIKKVTEGFMGVKPKEHNFVRKVTPEIIEELEAAVGKKNVNTNGMDRIIYCHDLAPLPKEAGLAFNCIPDVIVRPEKPEHIAAVMKIAFKHGIPVTPRGNATWGLGGCMPTNAGIIIDMTSKMNKVLEINTAERYVRVQAGCTWKNLLEACQKKGYIIGSYPSSFPAGTIGAWISTNGMGIGSYKYKSAKDNILNSHIIVDNGDIITTGFDGVGCYGMGYNLNQFFSGAEGTLGVLADVTFRIYPLGEYRYCGYEYDALSSANPALQEIVKDPSVVPLHLAWSDYMHFQNQHKAGIHAPDVSNLFLITFQGDAAHNDLGEAFADAAAEKNGGRKVSADICEHEWDERCYEFRARKVGVGEIPAEVIVPAHNWGEYVEVCYEGFDAMKMEPGGIIGVMVDRSTTLFMPYYFKDDELITGMLPFGFNFYMGDRAAEYGGRSTGLGVFFAWQLDVIHNSATVKKMRELKTVLDHHDVVNPGHVVCANTRFGIKLGKPIMSIGSIMLQTMKKMFPKNKTFEANRKRFRYNDLEHLKTLDRHHKLGDGSQ